MDDQMAQVVSILRAFAAPIVEAYERIKERPWEEQEDQGGRKTFSRRLPVDADSTVDMKCVFTMRRNEAGEVAIDVSTRVRQVGDLFLSSEKDVTATCSSEESAKAIAWGVFMLDLLGLGLGRDPG